MLMRWNEKFLLCCDSTAFRRNFWYECWFCVCVELNVVFAGVSNEDEKHRVSLKWTERRVCCRRGTQRKRLLGFDLSMNLCLFYVSAKLTKYFFGDFVFGLFTMKVIGALQLHLPKSFTLVKLLTMCIQIWQMLSVKVWEKAIPNM